MCFKRVPTSVMLPVAILCHSYMHMLRHVYSREWRGTTAATAPDKATASLPLVSLRNKGVLLALRYSLGRLCKLLLSPSKLLL